jgi:hypothetical protein
VAVYLNLYPMDTKTIITGVLFLLIISTGFWLFKKRNPYHWFPYTLHKLLALAFVVLSIIVLSNLFKDRQIENPPLITIMGAAVIIIILFITGALFKAEKLNSKILRVIHMTGASLIIAAASLLAYFFTR